MKHARRRLRPSQLQMQRGARYAHAWKLLGDAATLSRLGQVPRWNHKDLISGCPRRRDREQAIAYPQRENKHSERAAAFDRDDHDDGARIIEELDAALSGYEEVMLALAQELNEDEFEALLGEREWTRGDTER